MSNYLLSMLSRFAVDPHDVAHDALSRFLTFIYPLSQKSTEFDDFNFPAEFAQSLFKGMSVDVLANFFRGRNRCDK